MYSGLYGLLGPDNFFYKIQDAIDHQVRQGQLGQWLLPPASPSLPFQQKDLFTDSEFEES